METVLPRSLRLMLQLEILLSPRASEKVSSVHRAYQGHQLSEPIWRLLLAALFAASAALVFAAVVLLAEPGDERRNPSPEGVRQAVTLTYR